MANFAAALHRCLPRYSSFIIACSLAITLQIIFFSPISPDLLELPKTPVSSDNTLQSVTKLGEGFLKAPEDVAVDENGVFYTATRDGWIKRRDKDGLWQNWTMLNSSTLLGITVTKDGGIVVCDSEKGLLKAQESGVTTLLSYVNGSELRLRCLKYWLKGEKEGETEIFIDNLPGAPDNINLAPDGSFWIALLQLTSDGWEFMHTSKLTKHLIASFPKMIKLVNGVYRKAMVVNVGADGMIIRKFGDSEGKVMTFVTSALEFEGNLYLGNLNTDFIGKLQLSTNS